MAASKGHTINKTHGMSYTRVYRIYTMMLQRVLNPHMDNYGAYGGRGIDVCDRWYESFEGFLADMGEPPTLEHTLDRINTNGDYEPDNCRWATKEEQMLNRCTTRWITFDGVCLSLGQWAKKTNINRKTLTTRLGRGWSIKRTLTEGIA